jgi:hypothetical protein
MAIFDNPETPEPVDYIAFWRAEGGELLGVSYRRDGKIYLWDIQTQTEQEVNFEEAPNKTPPDTSKPQRKRPTKQHQDDSPGVTQRLAPTIREPFTRRNNTDVVARLATRIP